ncbi:MAG: hypothetical protein RIQ79_812 [Verrucomicrobiota bacterium]|jgi:prepilin-type N-terminal cleavage/methylation domain-containing protein/prepilin-type processing-associated H-X9-DG protein
MFSSSNSPFSVYRRRAGSAFTLIELLTVIAIIGILAAIIIPTVGRVRAKAASTKSASNLRQLGIALNLCIAETKRVTGASNFDQTLCIYLGYSKGSNGQYAMAAENFFTHPREESTPKIADAPRRSYAQQNEYSPDGGHIPNAKEAIEESRTLGKVATLINNPSQVMIYTERAGPGNPGGCVGMTTYTGMWCGNQDPADVNPDFGDKSINGTSGLFNYCFVDGHVETRYFNDVKMLGRGSKAAPRGVWTITEGD